MIFNYEDVAETYAEKYLMVVGINGNCFNICLDTNPKFFNKECEKYHIRNYRFVEFQPWSNWNKSHDCTYDRMAMLHGYFTDEEKKRYNPLLYLIDKMYKEKYKEDVELYKNTFQGFNKEINIQFCPTYFPCNAVGKVADTFEDLVTLIHEYAMKRYNELADEKKKLEEKKALEELKDNIRFKSDPNYYLVKPKKGITIHV